MNPEIQIQVLRPGDGRLYRDVRLRALEDAPDAFATTHAEALDRPDSSWEERMAALRDETDRAVVAIRDGRAVGLAVGFAPPDEPGTAHLFQVWVDPAERGNGIARLLTLDVMRWAERRGFERLVLGVTRGNSAAESLYESLGFEPTGETEDLRPGSTLRVSTLALSLDQKKKSTSR